jgi:hypothetical protein
MRQIGLLLLSAAVCLGDVKMQPADPLPSELPAAFASLMSKDGMKVMSSDGKAVCEIWVVSAAPSGPETTEEESTFKTIPHGALIGAIRFTENGSDRRGQTIKPGVYSLRYSMYPVNGDHQGVAPQRDFLVMTPIADDQDPKATPDFDTLVGWSKKASGTPHPAVLSIWKDEPGDYKGGVVKMGDHDWVLQMKLGDQPMSIIVVGQVEG